VLQATSFQNPTLTFLRATPRSLALDQLTVDVTFRVDNPNPESLSLARANCALALEGKTVASVAPLAGLSIGPSGPTEVTFPTTVRLGELAGGLSAALDKKVLHWKASGEVGVQSPIGVIALPLSAEGDLPVPQAPKVSLGTPKAELNGFTRLRLLIPLTVENPNAFSLPLGVVGGALTFAGQQVGRVDADGKGEPVTAGGKRTLEVAVALDLLSAGAAVAGAVSSGEADFALEGTLSSGGATLPISLKQHLSLSK
jgi:LEA14-like dessication related protein